VLKGEVKDILLLDVTPLSLGLETMGGVMTKLIERNTTIPTSKTQTFSTAADSQTSVEISVYQGERDFAADNKSLGKFMLSGIPMAPRGVPQIEVTYDIDANGILNVKAKDKASGKEQQITISGSSGLSKDDIERMKKDAEANAEADKKKRELVETRNMADTMCYTAEKMLKDAGDKVKPEDKSAVEAKIEALRKVKDTEDIAAMKKAADELGDAAQKVGATMYEADKTAGAAGANAGAKPGDTAGAAGEEKKAPVEGEYQEPPKA
jgi:molecular chaperone DnaK